MGGPLSGGSPSRWILSRCGGLAASDPLGLDLADDADLARWLVAACLLSGRVDEGRALDAFRAVDVSGLASPDSAAQGPLAEALSKVGFREPERAAAVITRALGTLRERYAGSLSDLARDCDGLEELGRRLAALAPGVGAATVMRFLRPLRDRWPAAQELPLSPAARAAAVCVGLIGEGEDEEGEPGALRAALRDDPGAPPLVEVEAALERLGSRACLRGRASRCPLGSECPRAGVPV